MKKLLINPSDTVFVAGHRGMVGSAVCRAFANHGYTRMLTASRSQLDLCDAQAVSNWFTKYKPDIVVLAAAKVGGIHANESYPADFLIDNLKIQLNVIETAWRSGVRRLLFLGSSCIYPKHAKQPIREESLLTGPLEPTNEWYALAKISGIKLCQALRKQHGFDAISLMPTNLYGPGDNYHPTNSHVLPALIRRFHEAVEAQANSVTCWGSGTPLREFLHVDDLAEACIFALENWDPSSPDSPRDQDGLPLTHLNVGTGIDLPISSLAQAVSAALGFQGDLLWDQSKPDGTPKKQLDVSRLASMGWQAKIPLDEGLARTVALFREQINHNHLRF